MFLLRQTTLLLSIAAMTATCDRVTAPGTGAATWKEIPLDQRVTDAYTRFGFELFRDLRSETPDRNVFVSPTSAAFALALIYNGAVGQTAGEIAGVLGLGDLEMATINETNRLWLDALQQTGDPRAELAVANSVWYRRDFSLVPDFRDRVGTTYRAQVEEISSAAAINRWVDQATRGRIDGIIAGEIPGNVVAYLINAVYFRADWTRQFRESNTRPGEFRRPDGSTVTVPMMSQTGAFEMRGDEDMQMLRLPYGSGRFSMILALPREGRGLHEIASRLQPESWRAWMTEFSERSGVQVSLPRFEVEWESSLTATLNRMGMVTPFAAGNADFSGMFTGGGPWLDDVFQKTFLKVDERGTEAAAVTAGVMVTSMPPSFVFDRPFFLAIYDHATSTVLFLGQITDPS